MDQEISGKVYAIDSVSNTIVLEEAGDKSSKPNYRVIKTSFVKEVSLLDKKAPKPSSRSFGEVEPAIGPVSLQGVVKKESAAAKAAHKYAITRGQGVTKEGQMVFDQIAKTLPCRWHGKSIIVFDEVRIDPPYTVEATRADDEKSTALQHVRRIVEHTQEKIAAEVKGG